MTRFIEIQPPEDARTIAVPVASSWFMVSEKPDAYVAVIKKQRRYYIDSFGCGTRRRAEVYLAITARGGIAVPKLQKPRQDTVSAVIVAERRLPYAIIHVMYDEYMGHYVYADGYIILERAENGEWKPSRSTEPDYFLAAFKHSMVSRVGCAKLAVEPMKGTVIVAAKAGFCCAIESEAAVYAWIKWPGAVVRKRFNECAYRGDCIEDEKLVEVRLERDKDHGAKIIEREYMEIDETDVV